MFFFQIICESGTIHNYLLIIKYMGSAGCNVVALFLSKAIGEEQCATYQSKWRIARRYLLHYFHNTHKYTKMSVIVDKNN